MTEEQTHEGGSVRLEEDAVARRGPVNVTLSGVGVSSGIAIGQAHVVERGMAQVPEYALSAAEVEEEIARFADAIRASQDQVRKLRARVAEMSGAAGEELGYLLEAHLHMLTGSRLIRGVEARIRAARLNAEAAVQAELAEIAADFASVEDAYLSARMQDIREVASRLIRNLTKTPYQSFSRLAEDTIILAEEITPADTALMDPGTVLGFASALGGAEGHTAIMARSLGIAGVVGVAGLGGEIIGARVRNGDRVIVDGETGQVVLNPDTATVARFEKRAQELRREARTLDRLRDLPAVTRDGVRISLQANVELPIEIGPAREHGAEGIGLLRSEFMFMNRPSLPSEDEQYEAIREFVHGMGGQPVTVRTLDVGADKLSESFAGKFSESANPALGLRAIRFALTERDIFETQLAAILRAAAEGPVRILLPMITTAAEVRQVREILDRVARDLRRRRIALPDEMPPLGVMIEVPAAALSADSLAFVADFFSIGTNDLTMYTLAIDRGNDQVAALYDPLNPAVLRLIQFATEAALRAGIPVNLCGEMAADPRYTALLLGFGLRDLSMSPAALPRVKQRIRALDLAAAERRSKGIMAQVDSGRIAALLDDLNTLA